MPSPILAVPAPPAGEDEQCALVWKKRFEKRPLSPNPVITTLDVEYNELAQSWKRFHEKLAPEDQVLFQERAQDAHDVLDVVRNVQSLWMSSPRKHLFSRAMALSNQFLSTFETHTVLLKALPHHESNLSLLYGVLQSILKASAKYPKIMEGILKALVKINESICIPKEDSQSPSAGLSISPIAHFYSLTFFFLGEVIDWYLRRSHCRLLQSLRQDVYRDLRSLVSTIRKSAKEIIQDSADTMDMDESDPEIIPTTPQKHDYLCRWEEARTKQVGLQDGKRRSAGENAFTRQLIWEIENDAAQRERLRLERSTLLAQMLTVASQRLRIVTQQNSGIACLTTTASQDLGMQDGDLDTELRTELTVLALQDASRFQWSQGLKHKYTRTELQTASKHLQNFFDSDDQATEYDSDVEVHVEDSVMTSLQQWVANSDSKVLAVGGSPSTVFPSPVALISARCVSVAQKARLPVISHFCSLPERARDGMTPSQMSLIALAYSLIRQLIDCLPPMLEGHPACNLSADRFKPLNGTLTSWKEVLSLIDVLLHYAPPLVVCIINGLDVIEDASTDLHIRSLVRTLLVHTRHQPDLNPEGGEQRVLLKVLFTVSGRPASLIETMSENHLVLSESNRSDQPSATDQTLNPDVGVVMMNA